ncbi:TadE family type IV pilus minor pilin [Mycobacterium servetii]|uniref:TadE family type IV pilus minor pilin n=1 Tax=Mycobacterium servetii TaxID=3237418 RepID=A0ABV4BUL1_9MYCO
MVVVLALCLGGVTAVSMQLRCVDAAREAARLAARGDQRSAFEAARRLAPAGARIQVRRDGDLFVATVVARSPLLPTLAIGAKTVSAAEEPG